MEHKKLQEEEEFSTGFERYEQRENYHGETTDYLTEHYQKIINKCVVNTQKIN